MARRALPRRAARTSATEKTTRMETHGSSEAPPRGGRGRELFRLAPPCCLEHELPGLSHARRFGARPEDPGNATAGRHRSAPATLSFYHSTAGPAAGFPPR